MNLFQKFLTGFTPGIMLTSVALLIANVNEINNMSIFMIGTLLSTLYGIQQMFKD